MRETLAVIFKMALRSQIAFALIAFCTLSASGQVLSQKELVRDFGIYKSDVYKIKKRDTILIQTIEYICPGGLKKTETFYEDEAEVLKQMFKYDSTENVIGLTVVRNQTDTSVFSYSQSSPFIEIITGGIPDSFPVESHYENGLLKLRTDYINSKKIIFFYKYSFCLER